MAKNRKNINIHQIKPGTGSSWSNSASRAALATQGTFSVSMPKLVQGVAYLQSNGELKIEIRSKKDNEYDKIVNIVDLVDVKKLTTEYGNDGEVTLTYSKWRKRNSSTKTITLVFASGYSKNITLRVPGKNSQLIKSVDNITSSFSTSPYENILAADTSQYNNTNLLVGVYPKADPYDVFNYSGVFSYNLPFAYYINSDSLNEVFIDNGVSSSNSQVDKGISTRGVGHLFPAEKEQEVHFINLVYSGSTDIKNRDEIFNQLNSTTFTYGFIYGKNLFDIPDDAPTFYVCKNDGDTSFFRTTSKDCDGTTIGTRYLTGDDPAIFLDGQCCSLTCDGFSVVVKNTTVSDSTFSGSVGSIKAIVTGGQGDWSYKIENTTTGLSTTVSSAELEYEFTGLAFATSSQTPYKITVTDANGCKAIAYIQLSRVINEEVGLVQGCTDSNAITYDTDAELSYGCLYCKSLGPRGERYGGLAFGTSAAKSKATGEQIISNEHSKITHATTSANSNGKLYFKGAVHPAALSIINQDSDASYRLAIYSLGNADNANALTKTQILALFPANTQDGDLEYEWTSKAAGWYAIAASILNVPALADCVSLYRFKIGYGGCMDVEATNYDTSASYNNGDCLYNCPEKNVKILKKDTSENCIKTVYLARSTKNEKITWEIGGEVKTGAGPHLAAAGSNISVYVENSKTKCTNSGEYYIPEEDCRQTPQMARNMSSSMANMLLNSGGCTDSQMFNYDCNAVFDDGTCIPIITGCTDISSSNYSSEANVDDGSCIDAIEGCLFPNAANYNPLATINVPEMCEWGISSSGSNTGTGLVGFVTTTDLACPTNLSSLNINTTSNTIFMFFARVPYSTTIQLGSTLSAYQMPVGGNVTMQGLTISDITLPLENSGLNPSAVWKLTGTDANVYTQHTNGSGLQGHGYAPSDATNIYSPDVVWNDDGTFVTNDEIVPGYTNISMVGSGVGGSSAVFPADEGSIGPGVYVWELKMIWNGQTHYMRYYSVEPGLSMFNDACTPLDEFNIPSGTANTDFQPGFNVADCVDSSANNYIGSSTLSPNLVSDMMATYNFWGANQMTDDLSAAYNIEDIYTSYSVIANNECQHSQNQKYCLPPRIDDQIDYLSKCVMNGTVNWYRNHITGGSDLCEDIALWTTILIKYLVSRKGLECIFNCQDMHTPNYTPLTCNERWLNSGSKVWTYDNDTTYQGNGTYGMGDYVKFDTVVPWMGDGAPNTIWRVKENCGSDCGNPYGRAFLNGIWEYCNDDVNFSKYTVNYLDNFFKFATRYCKSCNPCSFNTGNQNSFEVSTDSFTYSTEDDGTLTVGGIPVDY